MPATGLERLRRGWLTGRVHWDAFRRDPIGYGQAMVWRIRRLRLRSRHRFSTLMGKSPRAYALWIARVEPKLLAAAEADLLCGIVPVIDCAGVSPDAIGDTLESVRAAGNSNAILIGAADPVTGGVPLSTVGELSELVGAEGAWLCLIRAGDRLIPDALRIYADAAAHAADRWILYSDDDLVVEDIRRAPHFKSEWNPDLFRYHDFITGSATIRVTRDMIEAADARDWMHSLVHSALGRATPVHIPLVLHHRRTRPKPVVPAKPAVVESGPSCSIIIPTRNRRSLLECCVEGVLGTSYANKELIIVDNDSDDPATLDYLQQLRAHRASVLKVPGPFNFSALNNAAVAHAGGELLCFLNNDVEILDSDWLSLMVAQALRPELGAVGARLLYPDGTVQHAGVVTGVGGGAAHAHRLLGEDEVGYFWRHRLPQQVSAVTAACLVVRKDKFLAVGGFDEQDFPVAFNDIDLCLKLNARGWQSFYEPRAVLVHHESKSRGRDTDRMNRARFAGELAALKRRWGTDVHRDPFHHPQLSPFSEQFVVSV